MRKHIFYVASIFCALISIGVHLQERDEFLKGQQIEAKNAEYALEHQTRLVADPVAQQLSDRGKSLNKVGVIFTFSGLICIVVAWLRHESGWYLIPIVLLLFGLMAQMLL
jgi:hypothetical protein